MKRLLIISPYFPPVNAADMQRIRMSLAYYKYFGWEPEVVTVDPVFADMTKDELLLESFPADIKVHRVKALSKQLTSKAGLGSIALRSLWFYRQTVNQLLKANKYDLIYFSTTQFPVCILGAYWKKRFSVPFVIDLQDPWHSDYYENKPKHEQPPKYWFSYRLNKYTEAMAMQSVDGLISVSQDYIDTIRQRYSAAQSIPASVITFGASAVDMEIAAKHQTEFKTLLNKSYKNIVYIGRGGTDMHKAINVVFTAMQQGLQQEPQLFKQLRFTFIGTSYAPDGQGKPSIMPLAIEYELEKYCIEHTNRISYYHTLHTLMESDALLIPGSDAKGYTASKLYPYLNTQKPMLAILNNQSPAADVLHEFGAPYIYDFNHPAEAITGAINFLKKVAAGTMRMQEYHQPAMSRYSAKSITMQQCELFDTVIHGKS